MKFRWTKKECDDWNDHRFLRALVIERRSELSPCGFLAKRLARLENKLYMGKPLSRH